MNRSQIQIPLALAAALAFAPPAWAVTSTSVVITQDQDPVAESRISLFNVDTGAQVTPQQDDDPRTALFLLEGGRYRVAVDGKVVEEIGVTGTGSRTVRIRLPATGTALSEGPPPAFVGLFGNYLRVDTPETGIGFFRNGAAGSVPEVFAVTGPRRVDHYGGTALVSFPVGGITPLISFHYSEGDGGPVSFSIPAAAGTASGVVYGQLSPSGSSGIATAQGLSGSADVRSRLIALGIDVPLSQSESSAIGIAATFRNWKRTYGGIANFNSGGNSFSQTRNQQLDETQIGLGLFGRATMPAGDAFAFHLIGRAGPYWRDSDLDSVEVNTCSFCPAADRNFTVAIRESDSDIGVFGDLTAALEFKLSPKASLWLGGSGHYLSRAGAIFNPSSGNQVFIDRLHTALSRDEVWFWEAMLGVTIGLE